MYSCGETVPDIDGEGTKLWAGTFQSLSHRCSCTDTEATGRESPAIEDTGNSQAMVIHSHCDREREAEEQVGSAGSCQHICCHCMSHQLVTNTK